MSIPILGRSQSIPAQLRINVEEQVASCIAEAKECGLGHGRVAMTMPFDHQGPEVPLWLDALHKAGCAVVAMNEFGFAAPTGGAMLRCLITFRLPSVMLQ